jgi:hypothetical protein
MATTFVDSRETAPFLVTQGSARISREYLEMPGLCLTLEQAARLASLDRYTCRNVLDAMIRDGFLRRCGDVYCRTTRDRCD